MTDGSDTADYWSMEICVGVNNVYLSGVSDGYRNSRRRELWMDFNKERRENRIRKKKLEK